ncbi:MAG: helix-turn-helix domain-containing protein [Solirubrobacteraceae bacterium]
MDRELLEGLLSEGLSLAAIGRRVGRHESMVAYWVERHGLTAAHARKHGARGGLAREDLLPLVEAGMSIAQIAEKLGRSRTTIRHWLRRRGLRTWSPSGSRRAAESAAARQAGLREAKMACSKHGDSDFVRDGRGYYRCRKCRAEAVSRRRRKMKQILVEEAGGACCVCGYADTMRALHFHHVDPAEKRLELNAKGVALSIDTLRAEARKCVLLCSNCHAEVEEGRLPLAAGRLPATT